MRIHFDTGVGGGVFIRRYSKRNIYRANRAMRRKLSRLVKPE